MTRLVVVGGGRMGNALIGGLLRSGWVEPAEITIAERREAARTELASRFPGPCGRAPAEGPLDHGGRPDLEVGVLAEPRHGGAPGHAEHARDPRLGRLGAGRR